MSTPSKTRWGLIDDSPVQEHYSSLLGTYQESLRGLEGVIGELSSVVGGVELRFSGPDPQSVLILLAEARQCFERQLLFAPGPRLLSRLAPGEEEFQLRFLWEQVEGTRTPKLVPLPGVGGPIHAWNEQRAGTGGKPGNEEGCGGGARGAIDLEKPGVAEDYLRFFCHHVSGEDGYFLVVEGDDEILDPDDEFSAEDLGKKEVEPLLRLLHRGKPEAVNRFRNELRERLFPITRLSASEEEVRLCAPVFYGVNLFHAGFRVLPNGKVEMEVDAPLEFKHYEPGTLPLKLLRTPGAWRRLAKNAQESSKKSSEGDKE